MSHSPSWWCHQPATHWDGARIAIKSYNINFCFIDFYSHKKRSYSYAIYLKQQAFVLQRIFAGFLIGDFLISCSESHQDHPCTYNVQVVEKIFDILFIYLLTFTHPFPSPGAPGLTSATGRPLEPSRTWTVKFSRSRSQWQHLRLVWVSCHHSLLFWICAPTMT